MTYDFLGRRVKKGNRRFVYNGYNQIADNGGNVYVWDPSAGASMRPLVWKRGNDVLYYTHDGNKNVSEVIAENGDVVAHYEYAPFGAVVAQQGALAAVNPWQFSSEYIDGDMGLMYYSFRHYDPAAGRWLSREEFAFDAQNHYEYLSNRPTTTTDHLGLYDEKVHFYLMYLMMLDLFKDKEKALAIAQGSQYPDSRRQFDAMDPWWFPWRWVVPSDDRKEVRRLLHNLNELKCCQLKKFRGCIKDLILADGTKTNDFLVGVYLHVYADTFSHVHAGVSVDDDADKDKECSYGDYIGHGHALTFPDDPRWVYFDENIGEQRLRDFIKAIEVMFGKSFSPEFKQFFEKIYETHQVTKLVDGTFGKEMRQTEEYVHWIDFIEEEARKRGLDKQYKDDNVFGKPATQELKDKYKDMDNIVTGTAMPALKDCLNKAGGTK